MMKIPSPAAKVPTIQLEKIIAESSKTKQQLKLQSSPAAPGLSRMETASATTPRKGRRMANVLDTVLRPSKMAAPAPTRVSKGKGGESEEAVTEPPKSLGPPTVVLVHRTSDNPAGAPDHLTSSVSEFFTLPKSVSPIAQILQHIGGTNMRKQLQQLILY
jgi:hypothetical protein